MRLGDLVETMEEPLAPGRRDGVVRLPADLQ